MDAMIAAAVAAALASERAAAASALASERATVSASALDKAAGVETQYSCAICQSLAHEPVTTSCGHLFCFRCLSTWVKGKATAPCPLCKVPMPITPTLTVSAVIAEAIAANNGAR